MGQTFDNSTFIQCQFGKGSHMNFTPSETATRIIQLDEDQLGILLSSIKLHQNKLSSAEQKDLDSAMDSYKSHKLKAVRDWLINQALSLPGGILSGLIANGLGMFF